MAKEHLFKRLFGPSLIIVAAVVAYWNSFGGVFVLDDIGSIRDNPHIRVLWPLSEAMSLPLWSSATTVDGRPLLSLSFALNHAIFGSEPWGYHLVNLLIHIAAGLLLFGIVRRTQDLPQFRNRYAGSGNWLALVVAIIWLVHPLQTQSVTYIVQRAESLMGLLFLLTLYCAIRGFMVQEGAGEEGEHPTTNIQCRTSTFGELCVVRCALSVDSVTRERLWYVAAVVACAVGMGVKQTMVSAPLLVLLYDWVFIAETVKQVDDDGSRGRQIDHRVRAPLLLLGSILSKRCWLYAGLFSTWLIVFGIIGLTWQESTSDFVTISPVRYLLTQPLVLLHYLRLSLWPSPLVLCYGWTLEDQWTHIVFPGLVILGLLTLMFRGLARRQWYGFVLAWFFLILAPTSSIAPTRQGIFEHRMYLSLAAIVAVVVIGAGHAIRRLCAARRQRAVLGGGLAAAVAVALVVLTLSRNADYHIEVDLWRNNLEHQPESKIAHLNMAGALSKSGRHTEAIAHYQKALRIDPCLAEAYNDWGIELDALGRTQEAMELYEQALQLKPGLAKAHSNMGRAYHQLNRTEEAIAHYRIALRLDPGNADAHFNLGLVLEVIGRPQEAVQHFQAGIKLDPERTEMQNKLGDVLQALGRVEEALSHYRQAVRLKPDHAEARNNLGNALLVVGRPQEAIEYYREALRLNPQYAEIHYNLGRAVLAMGRTEEATGHYRQALRLKPDMADAHYNLGNALVALGRIEEAIESYLEAVRINPDHIGAHNNLGALFREIGRLPEALAHLEQAVRLMPDSTVARENLRQTKAKQGESERGAVISGP